MIQAASPTITPIHYASSFSSKTKKKKRTCKTMAKYVPRALAKFAYGAARMWMFYIMILARVLYDCPRNVLQDDLEISRMGVRSKLSTFCIFKEETCVDNDDDDDPSEFEEVDRKKSKRKQREGKEQVQLRDEKAKDDLYAMEEKEEESISSDEEEEEEEEDQMQTLSEAMVQNVSTRLEIHEDTIYREITESIFRGFVGSYSSTIWICFRLWIAYLHLWNIMGKTWESFSKETWSYPASWWPGDLWESTPFESWELLAIILCIGPLYISVIIIITNFSWKKHKRVNEEGFYLAEIVRTLLDYAYFLLHMAVTLGTFMPAILCFFVLKRSRSLIIK
jgi:hypothetical protein